MNNNYYEIGTVGTTPIYEPVRAKRRALGKLYTESELQKAIKEERERRNMNKPCNDCKYNKSGKMLHIRCAYCQDYCNYKSVNKRKFFTVIIIIYALLIVLFFYGWRVLS